MNASQQRQHLVILVPYRKREEHLRIFVPYMESFLGSLAHRIVVIEQADDKPFNKGSLLNIGFSLVRHETSCVCFHDIDMLPLDDARYYDFPERTTHISGCIEQFDYVLPYHEYMGGVFLTPVDEFASVNGFSNQYWGWGSEDDEMFARYHLASISIVRKPGRYRSLPHERAPASLPNAYRLMHTLAAVAELPHEGFEQERIDELQSGFKRAFGVEKWAPVDVWSDGLSTLRFERLARANLREQFPFDTTISADHELIRVHL
jgi:N-terminal region of glycosyl transferase group 7/N-terminal domain of galactosyltransferase